MGDLRHLGTASGAGAARSLGAAVEDFLAELANPNTVRAYVGALRALAAELGAGTAVAELADEAMVARVAQWFADRWGAASARQFPADRERKTPRDGILCGGHCEGLFDSHGGGHRGAHHGVVAHTDETHHLHVCWHR